jgi:SAM-dependent methyltransferase
VIDDVLNRLSCPHCATELHRVQNQLRCEEGHEFDIARQGYVSLLRGGQHTGTADTPEMVAARAAFLGEGHYAGIAELVSDLAAAVLKGAPADACVVDLGGGTGYYLASVLTAAEADGSAATGLALDVSKHAARRAARAHPRIGSVVADAWRGLPVRGRAASVLLNVFAPRNPHEMRRILHPDGRAIVVVPEPDHLRELIAEFGLLSVDGRKRERITAQFADRLVIESEHPYRSMLRLTRPQVAAVIGMGPNAWHSAIGALESAAGSAAESVASDSEDATTDVTLAVRAYVLRRM